MKAHVDVATGEIHGCEKGSLEWYHEKGHIVFNSSPNTSWMLMIKSYAFDLWMLFITASIVYKIIFPFAVSFLSIYIFIMLYEEHWCNKYAKLNYKEVGK